MTDRVVSYAHRMYYRGLAETVIGTTCQTAARARIPTAERKDRRIQMCRSNATSIVSTCC